MIRPKSLLSKDLTFHFSSNQQIIPEQNLLFTVGTNAKTSTLKGEDATLLFQTEIS